MVSQDSGQEVFVRRRMEGDQVVIVSKHVSIATIEFRQAFGRM